MKHLAIAALAAGLSLSPACAQMPDLSPPPAAAAQPASAKQARAECRRQGNEKGLAKKPLHTFVRACALQKA